MQSGSKRARRFLTDAPSWMAAPLAAGKDVYSLTELRFFRDHGSHDVLRSVQGSEIIRLPRASLEPLRCPHPLPQSNLISRSDSPCFSDLALKN